MFDLNGKTYTVPEWILEQKLNQNERYAWHVGDGEKVERETEKAVLVSQMTDWGRVSCWCPKSVLVEFTETKSADSEKMYQRGCEYNEYLRGIAFENGIKLGNTRRTDSIIVKLDAAGVTYTAKRDFFADMF